MDYPSVLLSLTEVGITMAGFSSLATVIWRRSTIKLDTYRFEGMLINSLMIVAFGFLPFLLSSLLIDDEYVWRVGSGIFLLVIGSRGFMITLKTWQLKQQGNPVGRTFYVMTFLLVATCGCQLANVFFATGALTVGLYMVGVFYILASASVLFFLVFLTVIHSASGEAETSGAPDVERRE